MDPSQYLVNLNMFDHVGDSERVSPCLPFGTWIPCLLSGGRPVSRSLRQASVSLTAHRMDVTVRHPSRSVRREDDVTGQTMSGGCQVELRWFRSSRLPTSSV